jgi:hypothetical protein
MEKYLEEIYTGGFYKVLQRRLEMVIDAMIIYTASNFRTFLTL